MQEDLNKVFNKLSLVEQTKFIITNILTNNTFTKMHDFIKNNYYNYFLEGEELIKHKLKINNDRLTKNIYNELQAYEKAVDKCMVNQSRYKDIVYWVYDAQQDIENYCKSKYINGDKDLLENLVNCYNDTEGTIAEYGGEREGDQDQTLKKAVRILLKNPYLDETVKNTEEYKEYYEEFINQEENNKDGLDDVEYGKNDIIIEDFNEEIEGSYNNDETDDDTEGFEDDNDNDDYDYEES
jgi:hypothetical protein